MYFFVTTNVTDMNAYQQAEKQTPVACPEDANNNAHVLCKGGAEGCGLTGCGIFLQD